MTGLMIGLLLVAWGLAVFFAALAVAGYTPADFFRSFER